MVDNKKITEALEDHKWYGKLSTTDKVPIAEMVYRLYVPDYVGNFTKFATTKYKKSEDYDKDDPAAFLSLEYIHNNIHNWTGGFDKHIGHIAEPPVAGFDPIFYMHHACAGPFFDLLLSHPFFHLFRLITPAPTIH